VATFSRALERDLMDQLATVLRSLSPEELGEQMADFLIASVPEFERPADEDFRAGTVLSCASNLTALWEVLLDDDQSTPLVPPTGAVAWSRELVHRGLALTALLRAYRLGHGFAEDQIERAAADLEVPVELRWRVLAYVSRHFFAYVDAVCTQLVCDYEQEHARWIRGAAAARAELVEVILERQSLEPAAATKRLRYDVSRRHLAFVVWAEGPDATRPAGSLESVAAVLAADLGGGPVLTIPIGENLVWAWTSGEKLSDDASAVSLHAPAGVRAAIGTCASGLSGMADSHEQALAARRASELLPGRAGTVTDYRSGGLTALLTAMPGQAVTFAEAELGALASPTDAAARLRSTVFVYLQENLSPARTARRLGIHHNTVVYRVKQAEEILGHAVEPRRLELEVALRLAERLDALRAARDRVGLDGYRAGVSI
jgi:DNA-binding PucR family transcriptional regulator